jgi:hypothetical protein
MARDCAIPRQSCRRPTIWTLAELRPPRSPMRRHDHALIPRRWIGNQRSAVAVACRDETCSRVLADQQEIGALGTVRNREDAICVICGLPETYCGVAPVCDIRKINFIVPAEAGDRHDIGA